MQLTAGDDVIVGEEEDAGLTSPETAIPASPIVERANEFVSQSQTGNLLAEESQINVIDSRVSMDEMGSLGDGTRAMVPMALQNEILVQRRRLHGTVHAILASQQAILASKNEMYALEDAILISEDSINYYERNGIPLGNSILLHNRQLEHFRNLLGSLIDQIKDEMSTKSFLIAEVEEVTEFFWSIMDKYTIREIRESVDEIASLENDILALPNVFKFIEDV